MKKIRRTNRFKRLYKERIAHDERLKRDFIESVHTFLECQFAHVYVPRVRAYMSHPLAFRMYHFVSIVHR